LVNSICANQFQAYMFKSVAAQKFKLTASYIASYFKHKCDRNFRYSTIEAAIREKPGIGWGVPKKIKQSSRAGIRLLMEEGDRFEVDHVRRLINQYGEDKILVAGFDEKSKVQDLTLAAFAKRFSSPDIPSFIAQLAISFAEQPEWEATFLTRFNLNPVRVKLGISKPDLLEVIPAENSKYLLRIWDFKASQAARHEHFIQVAFYSLLLEHIISEGKLSHVRVDTLYATIQSYKGEEQFELEPYRKAVQDFLNYRVPRLFALDAANAHFHIADHCAMCEYLDHCRAEAEAGHDLSRIPYMSSESKRRLRVANLRTHRELAHLEEERTIKSLRTVSHDLYANLNRYRAAAQALDDGQPRSLEAKTMLMPQWENIRIVLNAEQDAVTNTCFALGIKVYQGWNQETQKPDGLEKVFLSSQKGDEAGLLLDFLKAFNQILEAADTFNKQLYQTVLTQAEMELQEAETRLTDYKSRLPKRLYKDKPDHLPLLEERKRLEELVKAATKTEKDVRNGNHWELLVKQQKKLHIYVYDSYDMTVIRSLIERHLFSNDVSPELLREMGNLLRIFPPSSVLPDPDTFRSIPGTVVTQVLRAMVALPIPYLYDLKSVSRLYKIADPITGEERGFEFNPRYGYSWEFSNQVAFERIHDVWNGQDFIVDGKAQSPHEVRAQIEQTILSKLRATDSVIQKLKKDFGPSLLLRKEPFKLHHAFDPIDFQTLEALKVFTLLETSLEELEVKHTHTLPVEDRNNKFLCIRGLHYLPEQDTAEGSLWFAFDPSSRDAKFEVGDFNLVVTEENNPGMLLGDIDGTLFTSSFRAEPYKVILEEYNLLVNPPQVKLRPVNLTKFKEKIDLTQICTLDKLYVDYNSKKVVDILQQLNTTPENALHIQHCIENTPYLNWQAVVPSVAELETNMSQLLTATGKEPQSTLNAGQWAAWRGVFSEPISLVWGPPGTGKTHTIAHILIGYVLASQMYKKPIRILVTAFTHHAIVNVLNKVVDLAYKYNIPLGAETGQLRVLKMLGSNTSANDALREDVERQADDTLESLIGQPCSCIVIGSTVWSVYKGMKGSGQCVEPRPWFDVVLVDEASQMKLPDSLLAFCASRPQSNIILAGDDMQLPPIVHGEYAEEQEYMLSSVFAFIRHQIQEATTQDSTLLQRRLFQLNENFRMNEPITAYSRDMLYNGNFQSAYPDIRIQLYSSAGTIQDDSTQLLTDLLLDPDKPVVLCRYTPTMSYTARNPIEAELVALLTTRLKDRLMDRENNIVYTPESFAKEGLGILSPHRAQNSTIRQLLTQRGFDFSVSPLLIDTVEKLQGKEREVILVSYGVADEEYATAEADFLLNRNRFNVALTRARCKVIVFCSEPVFNVVPTDKRTLLESMMLKEFRNYCISGSETIAWTSSDVGDITLTIQWKGFDK